MACCSFRRSPGRSLSTSISSISSTGSFSYSTSNASAAILAWSAVSLMGGGRSSSSSSPGVSFAFSAEDDARTATRRGERRARAPRRAARAPRPTRANVDALGVTADILCQHAAREAICWPGWTTAAKG